MPFHQRPGACSFLASLLSLSVAAGPASSQEYDLPVPQAADAPVAAPADALTERVEEFGRSVQNRPLRVYVLENRFDAARRDVTLIYGAVHGNETSTPGVVEYLRAHLKKHPSIVKGRRVLLLPVLNPDGLARRSRRNARNVDINRNYPGTWRRIRERNGFKGGPTVASEPETRAMIRLVARYAPRKIVSIHQPLNCLIYSGERSRPLALAIQKHNKYPIRTGAGYPTPGGFGGYCDKVIKTPVVTIELPWQSAASAWKRNARALVAAIELPPA
jgi:hypothetical protein